MIATVTKPLPVTITATATADVLPVGMKLRVTAGHQRFGNTGLYRLDPEGYDGLAPLYAWEPAGKLRNYLAHPEPLVGVRKTYPPNEVRPTPYARVKYMTETDADGIQHWGFDVYSPDAAERACEDLRTGRPSAYNVHAELY